MNELTDGLLEMQKGGGGMLMSQENVSDPINASLHSCWTRGKNWHEEWD